MKKTVQSTKISKGEDVLATVDKLTLTINGADHVFDLYRELLIPDDYDEIEEAARNAPAKLAFWDGQMERGLYVLRNEESRLKELEGTANKWARLKTEGEREGELVAEGAIQAVIDCRRDVVAKRQQVNELKYHHGLLRSVRDAASQRAFILSKLIGKAPIGSK